MFIELNLRRSNSSGGAQYFFIWILRSSGAGTFFNTGSYKHSAALRLARSNASV